MEHDVAIVGGSLGGCTAAALLARQGVRVALIERAPKADHYKRACTHYIQAPAAATLDRLGLTGAVEAAGAVYCGGEVVSDLLRDAGGRPAGVVTRDRWSPARVVVGVDGRGST